MIEFQAIALADDLHAEAKGAGLWRIYTVIQAANHTQWAVHETDGEDGKSIQVWISPELSFPL